MPAVQGLEESWDQAFRRAVAVPRNIPVEQAPKMFYVCPTPVPQGAPAVCGAPGTTPRLGDLRYNILAWVDRPQMAGPLGYGPSSADPETGEIIQAGAYMYGAGLDSGANEAQLIIDVLNKDLSIDSLITGENVRDFIKLNLQETDPRAPQSGPWTGTAQQPLTAESPQKVFGAFGNIATDLESLVRTSASHSGLPKQTSNRRAVVDQLIAMNPQLEQELVETPEVRSFVMSMAPGETWRRKLNGDPSLYRAVARQNILRMDEVQAMENRRLTHASLNNLWLAEFSDDALVGLAREMAEYSRNRRTELQAQGKSATEAAALTRTEVYNKLRIAYFRGVGEHEVGHTLGLMHNFIGSFDAMNFKDGFWELRKQTIGMDVSGQRVLPTAPQNLAVAAKQNEAQKHGKMRELQYSTVMDYGARLNADVHGVGKYDEAAILFTYANGGEPGYVEVFNQLRGDFANPNLTLPTDVTGKQYTVRGAHVELPYANLTHWTPSSRYYSDRFHYTTLPFHFADKGLGFQQSLDQGLQRMANRGVMKWSDMKVVYDDLRARMDAFGLGLGSMDTVHNWEDAVAVVSGSKAQGAPVEVPYMFCSDYEVGANPACNRWDQGADLYEITHDWISRFTDYYAFTNFKRDRYTFSPTTVLNRNLGRLLGNFPNVYQNWLFDIYFYQSYFMANPPLENQTPDKVNAEFLEDYMGFADPLTQNYQTMAVIDSTNVLLQQLVTPAAGYYGKNKATGRWVYLTDNNLQNRRFTPEDEARLASRTTGATGAYSDIAYVPRGSGRSMYTLFENDGYDFFTRPAEVGHFWDQYAALQAISASETNFLGVDRGGDRYKYSLPYYMTFPKQLTHVFNAMWSQRPDKIAANLVKDDATDRNLARVVPANYLSGEDLIHGFAYPAAPTSGSVAPLEKVEAVTPWSTRFYAEMYSMAFFTDGLKFDYANQNQVFRLGSGEEVTPAAGYEVVSFADPFGGGFSYAALRKVGDVNPPVGAALILTANEYRTQWNAATTPADKALWEGKMRDATRSLEIMRGMFKIFADPTYF